MFCTFDSTYIQQYTSVTSMKDLHFNLTVRRRSASPRRTWRFRTIHATNTESDRHKKWYSKQWYISMVIMHRYMCRHFRTWDISTQYLILRDGDRAHENRSRCGRIDSGLPTSIEDDNSSSILIWRCLRHPNVYRFTIRTMHDLVHVHHCLVLGPVSKQEITHTTQDCHHNTTKHIFQVLSC